jgi:hypothetical protein
VIAAGAHPFAGSEGKGAIISFQAQFRNFKFTKEKLSAWQKAIVHHARSGANNDRTGERKPVQMAF